MLSRQLQDETTTKGEDLYIRSVSFSPDGKYLATGAEDKLIRVQYYNYIHTLYYVISWILIALIAY